MSRPSLDSPCKVNWQSSSFPVFLRLRLSWRLVLLSWHWLIFTLEPSASELHTQQHQQIVCQLSFSMLVCPFGAVFCVDTFIAFHAVIDNRARGPDDDMQIQTRKIKALAGEKFEFQISITSIGESIKCSYSVGSCTKSQQLNTHVVYMGK